MVRWRQKSGEVLETNFLLSFWILLQSKGPKEDTAGADEQVGSAICVGGQLVSLPEQEHSPLVHGVHPRPLWPRPHGLLGAEERHVEGVLGGEEPHLVGQVKRAGLGLAAFSGEDHLGVDEVEAAGGDQEGVVAQREAVAEERVIHVCSPEQGLLRAGVSCESHGGWGGGSWGSQQRQKGQRDGGVEASVTKEAASWEDSWSAKLLLWEAGEDGGKVNGSLGPRSGGGGGTLGVTSWGGLSDLYR